MDKLFPKVMVTGHRTLTETEAEWATRELAKTFLRLKKFHGMEEAISGMALGIDTLWANLALKHEIPLAAYIPFEDQPIKWPQANQKHWALLRSKASREVLVGEKEYKVWLLHARNDAMIKDSDLAVAVLNSNQSRGGTFSAVEKITKLGKPMIRLDPYTQTLEKVNF